MATLFFPSTLISTFTLVGLLAANSAFADVAITSPPTTTILSATPVALTQITPYIQADSCAQNCAGSAINGASSWYSCPANNPAPCVCSDLTRVAASAHSCAASSCSSRPSTATASNYEPELARSLVTAYCEDNGQRDEVTTPSTFKTVQTSVSTFTNSNSSTNSSTVYPSSTDPWHAGKIIGVIVGGLAGIALIIMGILARKRYANRSGRNRHQSGAGHDQSHHQDYAIEISLWQHSIDSAIRCTMVVDTGAYEGNWVSEKTLNAVGGESTILPEPIEFSGAGGQLFALKKASLSFRNANTNKGETRTAEFYVAPSEVQFQIVLGGEDIRKHNILPPAFLGIIPVKQTKKEIEEGKEAKAKYLEDFKKQEKSRAKRQAEEKEKRKQREQEDKEKWRQQNSDTSGSSSSK